MESRTVHDKCPTGDVWSEEEQSSKPRRRSNSLNSSGLMDYWPQPILDVKQTFPKSTAGW